MKKRSVMVLLLAAIMVMSFAMFTACTTDEPEKKEDTATQAKQETKEEEPKEEAYEDVTLSLWINEGITGSEKEKDQSEWMLTKWLETFEEQNPGVTVEFTVPADQQAAHQQFKATAMANSGPDVANLWSGLPLVALKDVVLILNDYVPQEDLDNIIPWNVVRDGLRDDGDILGYPFLVQQVCGFVYNKQIIAEAGLDFENNYPTTVDGFMEAMQKIKDAGYLPIAAQDDGYNSLFVFSLASWWVQMVGNDRVLSNSKGETKFADDEYFLEAFKRANELYEKGYINEDYANAQDIVSKLYSSEAAMHANGMWGITDAVAALGEENVGFINVPDLAEGALVKDTSIGGPGQCLVAASYTDYPELAVELMSFLNSRDVSLEYLKAAPNLPIRSDITIQDLGWEGQEAYENVYRIGANNVYWSDNSMVPEVMNEYYKIGTLIVTGKLTPEEGAAKLDEKAAEVNE